MHVTDLGYIVFFLTPEPRFDRWFSNYDDAEEHVKDLALEWEMQGHSAEWLIVPGGSITV